MKSIYEETFNYLDELVDVLAHIEGSFLYRHYLDNIRLKLKKAQKQEKLLELYKELMTVKDELISIAWFDGSCDETEEMEADFKKRIKELENDENKTD